MHRGFSDGGVFWPAGLGPSGQDGEVNAWGPNPQARHRVTVCSEPRDRRATLERDRLVEREDDARHFPVRKRLFAVCHGSLPCRVVEKNRFYPASTIPMIGPSGGVETNLFGTSGICRTKGLQQRM